MKTEKMQDSPVMQKMLEHLNTGDTVITMDKERLGEDPSKVSDLINQYTDAGVTFVFTGKEQYDGQEPETE